MYYQPLQYSMDCPQIQYERNSVQGWRLLLSFLISFELISNTCRFVYFQTGPGERFKSRVQ